MYWDEFIQLILYFFNLNVSCFLVSFSLRFPNSLIYLFIFLFVALDSIIHQPWKHTLVNRQDYNFPSLVEVPSKYQKTWWNTWWLNERYLPSICMGENKIRLFLLKDSMNLENVWFRLVDLLLTFHKSLVIVWNSQRLWKAEVLEVLIV